MKMSLLTAYLGEGKEAKRNEMDKNFLKKNILFIPLVGSLSRIE